MSGRSRCRAWRPTAAWVQSGRGVVDVCIRDMERPNPHRLSAPVRAHVADARGGGGDLVADAPASRAAAPRTIVVWVDSVIRNPTRTEKSCRIARTSLDGSCTAAITETPTARPCESSSPKSCSTSVRVLRSPIKWPNLLVFFRAAQTVMVREF